MKVSSVSQMRQMDGRAITEFGIPEIILMENAGLAATAVLDRELGIQGKRVVVLCGLGNNGGDGFVVARKILSHGGRPIVFIAGDPSRFKGVAKAQLDILSGCAVGIRQIDSLKKLHREIIHSHGVVDALFGTGLDREVAGLQGDIIDLVNGSGKRVLSLDIPSGVNGNTGKIMGKAIRAAWTVTFGLPKIGNLLYPGYELCGRLYISHISFPPSLYNAEAIKVQTNDPVKLPPRSRTAHKGSVGDTLFIAGAANYVGAPLFCSLSFLKAGGGYSRLAAPQSITHLIAKKAGEIVLLPQKETTSGSISRANLKELLRIAEKVDMVVIGCGLSLNESTQTLARALVAGINKPVLIDGDGLTAVAGDLNIIRKRTSPTILTPHPGEMSRLTGKTTAEIDLDKINILQQTAGQTEAIIVHKGAHSLIGYPDGRIFINLSGNPGMATAGSGDVLAGTVAAMFGLGLSVEDAAREGVSMHGLAGDLAAREIGEDGITAQDIMDYLPQAIKRERQGIREEKFFLI